MHELKPTTRTLPNRARVAGLRPALVLLVALLSMGQQGDCDPPPPTPKPPPGWPVSIEFPYIDLDQPSDQGGAEPYVISFTFEATSKDPNGSGAVNSTVFSEILGDLSESEPEPLAVDVPDDTEILLTEDGGKYVIDFPSVVAAEGDFELTPVKLAGMTTCAFEEDGGVAKADYLNGMTDVATDKLVRALRSLWANRRLNAQNFTEEIDAAIAELPGILNLPTERNEMQEKAYNNVIALSQQQKKLDPALIGGIAKAAETVVTLIPNLIALFTKDPNPDLFVGCVTHIRLGISKDVYSDASFCNSERTLGPRFTICAHDDDGQLAMTFLDPSDDGGVESTNQNWYTDLVSRTGLRTNMGVHKTITIEEHETNPVPMRLPSAGAPPNGMQALRFAHVVAARPNKGGRFNFTIEKQPPPQFEEESDFLVTLDGNKPNESLSLRLSRVYVPDWVTVERSERELVVDQGNCEAAAVEFYGDVLGGDRGTIVIPEIIEFVKDKQARFNFAMGYADDGPTRVSSTVMLLEGQPAPFCLYTRVKLRLTKLSWPLGVYGSVEAFNGMAVADGLNPTVERFGPLKASGSFSLYYPQSIRSNGNNSVGYSLRAIGAEVADGGSPFLNDLRPLLRAQVYHGDDVATVDAVYQHIHFP